MAHRVLGVRRAEVLRLDGEQGCEGREEGEEEAHRGSR